MKNGKGEVTVDARPRTPSTRASSATRSARRTSPTRSRWRRTSSPRSLSRASARPRPQAISSPCSGSARAVLRPRRGPTSSPRDVAILRDELVELEKKGGVVVGSAIASASGGDIVEQALRAFAGYHSSPALVSRPDGVLLADTNLLFYYQNRLAAHGYAWDVIAPPGTHPVKAKPAVLAVGGAA